MVDLFEEVEEQLRSDRYQTLALQFAPWVTGLFALVLLGYLGFWGFKLYQDRNLTAATAEYQKGVDALQQNDSAGALTHFEASAKSGPAAYRALSYMQEGNLRLFAGKAAEAAKLYDQAAKVAPNPIFADLASLKAALAILDTAPYAQLQTRLTPLTDGKRPYALYAKEALAMAKLEAGKTAQARRDFTVLSLALGVPNDIHQRAQFALLLIDSGEASTAVSAAKIAAALPAAPQANGVVGPAETQGPADQSQSSAGDAQ